MLDTNIKLKMTAVEFTKALLEAANRRNIPISPLKLQKLTYYCQGYYLALTNDRIFCDQIKAWEYGPVVESVYSEYKSFGDNHIELTSYHVVEEVNKLSDTVADIIAFVLDTLGQLDPWALVQKTHNEAPWLKHYNENDGTVDNGVISVRSIKDFFMSEISHNQDEKFARIMDHSNDQDLIVIPDGLDTFEDFKNWLDNA